MMGISRRRFLTGTASLAVAGAGLPKIGWGDPLGLPIGIQLYTVGADLQKDAPATIKQIARIGYKEVETAGFGSAGSAAALRKLLDDNAIRSPARTSASSSRISTRPSTTHTRSAALMPPLPCRACSSPKCLRSTPPSRLLNARK